MNANHIVQSLSLLFVVDEEENAQFVLAETRAISNGPHVDFLSVKCLQEVLEDGPFFSGVKLGLRLLFFVASEQVDFEVERSLFQVKRSTEELGVVLIVQPVVRVGVDLVLVKFLIRLMLIIVSSVLIAFAPIAIITTVIFEVVATVTPVVEVLISVVSGPTATIATVIPVVFAASVVMAPIAIVVATAPTVTIVATAAVAIFTIIAWRVSVPIILNTFRMVVLLNLVALPISLF